MGRRASNLQFAAHTLYSWNEVDSSAKNQLSRTKPENHSEKRFFLHGGLWFDSKLFTQKLDGEWYTDGTPVQIRSRTHGVLDVAVVVEGRRIVQSQHNLLKQLGR